MMTLIAHKKNYSIFPYIFGQIKKSLTLKNELFWDGGLLYSNSCHLAFEGLRTAIRGG